jgi:hypothetical protein
MEFMNRGAGQHPAPAHVSASRSAEAPGGGRRGGHWKEGPLWLRVVWLVLLFSATILIVSLVLLMYFGSPKESNFIDKTKQQAVFLTNGQVYFGKVKSVNSQFLDLKDIYYLNVNQQVQPDQKGTSQPAQSSISLVKLGCELHGPVDRMIINREQVTFWENLKDDGQVAKAIAEWVKQNPNGQECQTASNSSNSNTSTEP